MDMDVEVLLTMMVEEGAMVEFVELCSLSTNFVVLCDCEGSLLEVTPRYKEPLVRRPLKTIRARLSSFTSHM